MLIRAHPCPSANISPPRCLPEAHRTLPPRTPDARSCRLSERERAGAFTPRSCERTIHGIAQQVKPEWWVAGRSGRRWSSLKKCGWPPAALPSVCRSRHPQKSVVRPATTDVPETVLRVVSSPRVPAMRGVQPNPRCTFVFQDVVAPFTGVRMEARSWRRSAARRLRATRAPLRVWTLYCKVARQPMLMRRSSTAAFTNEKQRWNCTSAGSVGPGRGASRCAASPGDPG